MKKVKLTTTLKQLRSAGACTSGYNKLVRSLQGKPFTEVDQQRNTLIRWAHKEPINLLHILTSNGVNDCLWSLRAVESPDVDRIARYIACDYADSVLHIFERKHPQDKRPRTAIEVARKFADGEATQTEMNAAWDAARDATRAAAWDAARAAAWDASRDAAWDASRDAQTKIIQSYLEE